MFFYLCPTNILSTIVPPFQYGLFVSIKLSEIHQRGALESDYVQQLDQQTKKYVWPYL